MVGFSLGFAALVDAPHKVLTRFGDPVEIPQLICRICDKPCSMAAEYVDKGGLSVCGDCANIVANVFNFYHGGEYLTWPNPERRRGGYRKKDIAESLRWQVFERDDFRCRKCGSRQQLRADHVHPESAGGEATLENLQTLCHRCNSKKGNRIEGGQ